MKKIASLLLLALYSGLICLPVLAADNGNGNGSDLDNFCKSLSQSCHAVCDAAALSGKSNPSENVSCNAKCADAYFSCIDGAAKKSSVGGLPNEGSKKLRPKQTTSPTKTQQ